MSGPDVLIVGAGPVGMVLACDLLQQGVSVRIVDRAGAPRPGDQHSRAILVVPRVLELLRRIGVSERLVEAGREVPGIRYYAGGRLLGAARLDRLPDTPYPFVLALPQRKTEAVLRERLHELGGTIERGIALEELAADGERPEALLRHRDGSPERVSPRWMVGADGAGSTTRRLLGLELGGDPTDVTYAIADAPVSGPTSADAHYYYSGNGLLAVVPMGNGLYRIAANVPHREGDEEPRWRELLQDVVDRRARVPLEIGEPTYARIVRPRCGIAAHFRSGSCFLVGDAAHVITPAGGQGMNLGIQDAVNLAWKLGAVAAGRLDEAVLDTYETDRKAAVARTSATTARVVRLAMQRSSARVMLRDATFMAADRLGLVQRVLAPLLSQLDVDYGEGGRRSLRRRLRAGQRAPVFAPALDRDRYTVVLWPGRRGGRDWAATCADLRARFSDLARIVDLAGGEALRRSFGPVPLIAAVRPDGHLAHVAAVDRPDEILHFLTNPTRRDV